MTLAEQAARRVELARVIGAKAHHWIATRERWSILRATVRYGVTTATYTLACPSSRAQPAPSMGWTLLSHAADDDRTAAEAVRGGAGDPIRGPRLA